MKRFISMTMAVLTAVASAVGIAAPATAEVQISTYQDFYKTIRPLQGVVQFNADGTIASIGGSGAAASQVQGNAASGATDTGNPVKIGCVYNGTAPTLTTGQRGDVQCDTGGRVLQVPRTLSSFAISDGTFMSLVSVPATQAGSAYLTPVSNLYWSPGASQWVMGRGDTTGQWAGGHGTIATGQVSIGTTATLIAAARTGRQKLGVTVTSAVQCAFGGSGVTLTTGWPLAAVAYASDQWDTAAALYGVCASTATVAYRELY